MSIGNPTRFSETPRRTPPKLTLERITKRNHERTWVAWPRLRGHGRRAAPGHPSLGQSHAHEDVGMPPQIAIRRARSAVAIGEESPKTKSDLAPSNSEEEDS